MRVKAMYNQYNYLFTIYIAITSLKNIKIKMKVSGYVKLSENRVYSCHNEPVMTCLEIDNNHFITGGFDRLLGKIDNSKDDIDAFTYEKRYHNGIIYQFLRINSEKFASCSQDGTVCINNTSTFKHDTTLKKEGVLFRCIELIDPSSIAAGGSDNIITVFDMNAKKIKYELKGHQSYLLALFYNGKDLFSSANDFTLKQWSLSDKTILLSVGLASLVRTFCEVDSKTFATGDEKGDIIIWNTGDKVEKKNEIKGHQGTCHVITKLRKKNVWVSGGKDKSIIFWDLRKGSEVGRATDIHFDRIKTIAEFGTNQLITTSFDTLIKVWDISY